MDPLTSVLAPTGVIAGFLGSALPKIFGMIGDHFEHKRRMQELEVLSRIDLQKADLALRQTQEDRAGQAFTAAIKSQENMLPAHNWAKTSLALFRPGLTLFLLLGSITLSILFQPSKPELLDYIIVSMFNMSSISLGYWFGARTLEKVQITQAFPAKK